IRVAVRHDDVFEIRDFFADRFDGRDDLVLALRETRIYKGQFALLAPIGVEGIQKEDIYGAQAELPEAFDHLRGCCHGGRAYRFFTTKVTMNAKVTTDLNN